MKLKNYSINQDPLIVNYPQGNTIIVPKDIDVTKPDEFEFVSEQKVTEVKELLTSVRTYRA